MKKLCELNKVNVNYNMGRKFLKKQDVINPVCNVTLPIYQGTTLGLVGESGCGKTTLVHTLLGFHRIVDGTITMFGQTFDSLSREKDWKLARKKMQVVFQDPFSSFNNRFEIWELITEPIAIHGTRDKKELIHKAKELLAQVGLSPQDATRHIYEFSGGQRQRIAIARALVTEPDFIICDEPTSALDVSVQSQICNLLLDLQKEKKFTYLFISHNLPLIKHMTEYVAVMYLGQIVEYGKTELIYNNPIHPYTKQLLAAIPDRKVEPIMEKELEERSLLNAKATCRYYEQCEFRKDTCLKQESILTEVEEEHYIACR